MGMVAILVMWPGQFEQTSFPHPKESPYEIWVQLAKFPHPKESPYEIWVQLAKWFQRRCLKMLTDGRTTESLVY